MDFVLAIVALVTILYFVVNAISLVLIGAPWKAWMLYLRGVVSAVFGYGILFVMSQEADSITASFIGNLSPLLWIVAVVMMALFLSFTTDDVRTAQFRARH